MSATLTAIGATLLALCGLPQAFRAWRDPRNARGLSWAFLGAWLAGELCLLVGTATIAPWPVLANYLFNAVLIAVMLICKASV